LDDSLGVNLGDVTVLQTHILSLSDGTGELGLGDINLSLLNSSLVGLL